MSAAPPAAGVSAAAAPTAAPSRQPAPTAASPAAVNIELTAVPIGADSASPAGMTTKMPLGASPASIRMRRTTTVPLSLFPSEVRAHMSELDVDGSGELEVGEIAAAVKMMREARDSARRMRCLVIALLVVLSLLVASVFGVSYAAAILATKVKASSGVLTDAVTGRALMTSGATLSVSFVPAPAVPVARNGGRRLLSDVLAEASASGAGAKALLSRRRRMVQLDSPHAHANARKLAGAAAPADSESAVGGVDISIGQFHRGRRMAAVDAATATATDPLQLSQLGVLPGSVAQEICRLTLMNRFEIFLPGFDPASVGAAGLVGTLQPAQTLGCGGKDMEDLTWFGLAADFTGKMFPTQALPSVFHVDCPPPVTAQSACTVSLQLFEDLGPQVDIVTLNSDAYDSPADVEGGLTGAERRAIIAAAAMDPDVIALGQALENGGQGGARRLETPFKYIPNSATPSYYINYTTRFMNQGQVYPFFTQPPLDIYPSNWAAPTRAGFPPSTDNPVNLTWGSDVLELYKQKRGTNQKDIARYTGNWTWINSIRYNDSVVASPWQNALMACSTSFLCLMGFHPSVTAGRIFTRDTWACGNATCFEARLRAAFAVLPANTVLTPAVLENTLKNYWLTPDQVSTYSAYKGYTLQTAYAQCPPNQVIEMTGTTPVTATNWYRCKAWNDIDIALGAQDIAFGCANSFEVLQWYFQWWQYYRTYRYKDGATVPRGATWAYPGSSDLQTLWMDYCTAYGSWTRPNTGLASWWAAGTTGHAVNVGTSGTTAKCSNGRKIPVCTSQRVLLDVI